MAVERRYPGLDRVICATLLGTPLDVQLADLDRFLKEVIQAFRDAKVAAAAQEAPRARHLRVVCPDGAQRPLGALDLDRG